MANNFPPLPPIPGASNMPPTPDSSVPPTPGNVPIPPIPSGAPMPQTPDSTSVPPIPGSSSVPLTPNAPKVNPEDYLKQMAELSRLKAEADRKAKEEAAKREAEAECNAMEEEAKREAEVECNAMEEEAKREAEADRKAKEEEEELKKLRWVKKEERNFAFINRRHSPEAMELYKKIDAEYKDIVNAVRGGAKSISEVKYSFNTGLKTILNFDESTTEREAEAECNAMEEVNRKIEAERKAIDEVRRKAEAFFNRKHSPEAMELYKKIDADLKQMAELSRLKAEADLKAMREEAERETEAKRKAIEDVAKIANQTALDVVLTDIGNSRLSLFKLLCSITGLNLPAVNNMLHNVPCVVLKGLSEKEAEFAKEQIEGTGATVELRESGAKAEEESAEEESAEEGPSVPENGIIPRMDNDTLWICGNGSLRQYIKYFKIIWKMAFMSRREDVCRIVFKGCVTDIFGSLFSKPFRFSDFPNLREVVMCEGVTKIPISGFRDCRNLKKLTLPDSLCEIEITAFKNCDSLAEVVNLHDGVKYGLAFNDAPLLKNVIPAQY